MARQVAAPLSLYASPFGLATAARASKFRKCFHPGRRSACWWIDMVVPTASTAVAARPPRPPCSSNNIFFLCFWRLRDEHHGVAAERCGIRRSWPQPRLRGGPQLESPGYHCEGWRRSGLRRRGASPWENCSANEAADINPAGKQTQQHNNTTTAKHLTPGADTTTIDTG